MKRAGSQQSRPGRWLMSYTSVVLIMTSMNLKVLSGGECSFKHVIQAARLPRCGSLICCVLNKSPDLGASNIVRDNDRIVLFVLPTRGRDRHPVIN
ncbi:hypothetical protein F4803DRAFT_142211 [Xylaria telfairii]|nr:hypothetical protein F4803DRAFT_142211 [Xylaria telfairii]